MLQKITGFKIFHLQIYRHSSHQMSKYILSLAVRDRINNKLYKAHDWQNKPLPRLLLLSYPLWTPHSMVITNFNVFTQIQNINWNLFVRILLVYAPLSIFVSWSFYELKFAPKIHLWNHLSASKMYSMPIIKIVALFYIYKATIIYMIINQ